jgi:hypothetical protein
MANTDADTVIIVGAGFSHYAGLPLTYKFTDALLEARAHRGGPSKTLVEFLSAFIHETFGHSSTAAAKYWPSLEDIFTCVDLSANSGHHLGVNFTPADLRTVRRALLARTILTLYQTLKNPKKRTATDWRQLNTFFDSIDPAKVGFISMNWDTVIERKLNRSGATWFDYCCDALPIMFPDDGDAIIPTAFPLNRRMVDMAVPIIKIHGSTNWLYCDNCRELFCVDYDDEWRIAGQLVRERDLDCIRKILGRRKSNVTIPRDFVGPVNWHCVCSDKVSLGTRIATFSYQKALEFPMFQKSWLAAERLLQTARCWVFIGYSLPPADFEFKYVLKRAQLSRMVSPKFLVVTGGTKEDVERTYRNYQQFFGTSIKRQGKRKNFFREGLSDHVIGLVTAQTIAN